MLSPKEHQTLISLSQINFSEIEDNLLKLASSVASTYSFDEDKTKEIHEAIKQVRSLNKEAERLKIEGITLTAKRLEIKRQCDAVNNELQKTVQINSALTEEIKAEEIAIQKLTDRYEKNLQAKVDRYKKNRVFYDNEAMKVKIQEANTSAENSKKEADASEARVENLQKELEEIEVKVPENILNILGKDELKEKLEKLTQEYEELMKKVTEEQ